jgi:hypothetical protein
MTLTLVLTSFFTNAIDMGLPAGKLTIAVVVLQPASCFLWSSITGGRTWSRTQGVTSFGVFAMYVSTALAVVRFGLTR